MSERMPDFAMPSDDELAAERRAEAIARARAADPTSASRAHPGPVAAPLAVGPGREDVQGVPMPPAPDPATRIDPSLRDPVAPIPRILQRRLLTIARNPVVAFAAGAAIVAAGFLSAPALTEWTERGSQAELERIVDEYAAAVSEGDVDAALALHRPEAAMGSMALLDAGIAPTTPPSVSCDAPDAGGSSDVVVARCSLSVVGFASSGGGAQLRLQRIDGGWQVVGGLEQRAWIAETLFDVVAIAGVPVADALDPEEQQYWLLPGGYDVEMRTSELIELTDLGGLVVADGGGYLSVIARVGDAVVAEVEAAALAFAQACVVDAATAATCGMTVPPPGRALTANLAQDGYPQDATTFAIPVRISGTGAPAAPNVEVLVRFSEDREDFDLEVTGVTEMYG